MLHTYNSWFCSLPHRFAFTRSFGMTSKTRNADMEKLITDFSDLKESTFITLSRSTRSFEDYLRSRLLSFPLYQRSELIQKKVFVDNSDSQEIWDRCMQYCHILSFDFLAFLIKETNSSDLQRKLTTFMAELLSFASKTKLLDPSGLGLLSGPASNAKDIKLIVEISNQSKDLFFIDLYKFCQVLTKILKTPFVLSPVISVNMNYTFTWYVPSEAHSVLMEWGMHGTPLQNTTMHISSILLDDREYWLSKTKPTSNNGTVMTTVPTFNLSNVVSELLAPSPLVTLTQVCSSYICKIIEDNLEHLGFPSSNLTLSSMPRNVSLALSYLGKLAYEESCVQCSNTIPLIRLPPVGYGLGLTEHSYDGSNGYQTFLHPLLQQFTIALYQTSIYFPRERKSLGFEYIPYFSSGIVKKSTAISENSTANLLMSFEAERSEDIKIYFEDPKQKLESNSSKDMTGIIMQCLEISLRQCRDGTTNAVSIKNREHHTFRNVVQDMSGYIAGRLMYFCNSKCKIEDMTEAFLNGVRASSDIYTTSVSHQSLQLHVIISKEVELLYYSKMPVQLLPKTQYLRISGITMSAISLKSLMVLLENQPSCTMQMSIQNCCISKPYLSEDFARVFQDLQFLVSLDISNCILSAKVVEGIAGLLRHSGKLQRFRWYCNNSSETDTAVTLGSIGKSTSLQEVQCRQVLSVENAESFFSCLQNENRIEHMNLSCCSLTYHSATQLGLYIQVSQTLLDLNIYGNNLDAQGTRLLACGLMQSKSLRSLDIGFNAIGDDGICALAEVFITNTCLEKLFATKTSTGSKGLCALSHALKSNRNTVLKVLDLSCNLIGDNGALKMAELLSQSCALLRVNLAGNQIGSTGASHIASALHTNKTLKSLNLSNNRFDSRGTTELKDMQKCNHSLDMLL